MVLVANYSLTLARNSPLVLFLRYSRDVTWPGRKNSRVFPWTQMLRSQFSNLLTFWLLTQGEGYEVSPWDLVISCLSGIG